MTARSSDRCKHIAFLLLMILAPTPCWAWGGSGHRMISKIAIRHLPADLPAFLKNPDTIDDIGELAREPDRSRGSGVPHDPDLDPAHYINMDDAQTIAGLPLSALPTRREDYATLLRQSGSDDFKSGYLPYAIEEGWQQLVKDFAYWRVDVAAQKLAASPSDTAWFARDQHLREMLTIRDLGVWSHFVGDASQPMHVSIHYDGWGNYPNPSGYPRHRGLHAQFETRFVDANVREADIEAVIRPYASHQASIHDRTKSYLAATYAKLIPLYRLAKTEPFDRPDTAEKAFTVECLGAGANELRDLIAEAWYASQTAKIGNFSQISVQEAQSGRIAAPSLLDALRGSD